MRHNKKYNPSFGRHRGPRKALLRGLVQSLVQHERIKTTLPKAKTMRPLVEKAITMGKRGDVHSRRLLLSRYPNKTTVEKIIEDLAPRFHGRQGGYTRIIKLGFRAGDQAPLAYIEFVDYGIRITGGWVKDPQKTVASEPATEKSKEDTSTTKQATEDKADTADKEQAAIKKALIKKPQPIKNRPIKKALIKKPQKKIKRPLSRLAKKQLRLPKKLCLALLSPLQRKSAKNSS